MPCEDIPRLRQGSVISVDPGQTTGIAYFEGGQYGHTHMGPQLHHSELAEFVTGFDTVVCETFVPTSIWAYPISAEYIGAIRTVRPDLVLQQASQAKTAVSDTKLERAGVLVRPKSKSPNKDINDAFRHLLLFQMSVLRDRDVIERIGR